MKILAFPGMGKTPLALQRGKYLDLDFGSFRDALGVPKEQERTLLKPFAKLMEKYEHDGFIVLSNDPKLMEVTRISKVYLPLILNYSATKLKVDVDTVTTWVNDWRILAKEHDVPVIWIKVGLDRYLAPKSTAQKGGNGK